MSAPRRRATYADLREVPEHLVAEILDGELVTSPRPASRHARAASAIGAALFDRFDGPPGGDAPGGGGGYSTNRSCISARMCSCPTWRAGGASACRFSPDVAAFELAPDWVSEVISSSTARIDRGRKIHI